MTCTLEDEDEGMESLFPGWSVVMAMAAMMPGQLRIAALHYVTNKCNALTL